MQRHRLSLVEFRETQDIGDAIASTFRGGELLEGLGVVEIQGVWYPLAAVRRLVPAKEEKSVPPAGGPAGPASRRAR